MTRLFLGAYVLSGFAGLTYEVAWTRLLTLQLGHSTAAASTVIAAFMGGLAAGSAVAARLVKGLSRRQALFAYAAAEAIVLVFVAAIPLLLDAAVPVLRWAYRDGQSGVLFPAIRLAYSLALFFVPAAALGATFPFALHWFPEKNTQPGRAAGWLYAANTAGAAAGAVATGFVILPAAGVSRTMWVGGAASALSIVVAIVIAQRDRTPDVPSPSPGRQEASTPAPLRAARAGKKRATAIHNTADRAPQSAFAAALTIAALTGAATFILEIAWMRVFGLLIGPSTYAFAATIAAFIVGIALGSSAGAWLTGRVRAPSRAAGGAITVAAIATLWASYAAGGPLPRAIAEQLAAAPGSAGERLGHDVLTVFRLLLPPAVALGIAFPLTLQLAGASRATPPASRLGILYAVNTVASLAGSLAAGFLIIPRLGLQHTILAAAALLAAAAVASFGAEAAGRTRWVRAALAGAVVAVAAMLSPGWDRELLASGAYKYARQISEGVDVESGLRAGTLRYYREGAAGTVSVRQLTGELSMSIDGKVDASNAGDLLTQKLLAHLPLLLHPDPQRVAVIGLGSGITAGAALVHPVAAVDVVEISPQVVDAAALFADDNGHALADPKLRLILGDGRSHLMLSTEQYDVIVSEPSNPWMAGIAALFTREFLEAARRRLAPGGIVCQWAHIYDISEPDLQSIVATFASVFPEGTMWLAGGGDLLLIGSDEPLTPRLDRIEAAWHRPGVADDLARASVRHPFSVLSLFAGGPEELRRYGAGVAVQNDDRMALEFTAPRAVNSTGAADIAAALRQLLPAEKRPPAVSRAFSAATAAEWRGRGAMLMAADAYAEAYDTYVTAVRLDPADADALNGLIRSAVAAGRDADARVVLERMAGAGPPAVRVALSRLYATTGNLQAAEDWALKDAAATPPAPEAIEQLASLYADAGDERRLGPVVEAMQRDFPVRPATLYYSAALAFLRGDLPQARDAVDRTIALEPRNGRAHNLRGAILATTGDRDGARRAFHAALAIDRSDSATYANLGLLELDSANRDAARGFFAEALSLDPGSPAARKGLALAARTP